MSESDTKSVRVFGADGRTDDKDALSKLASPRLEKATASQQADTDEHTGTQWYRPPYDPEALLFLMERHETHAACVSAKAKNVAGFGFDLAPHESIDEDTTPPGEDTVRDFWFGPDSTFQLGPDNAPASPHDVLEHGWEDHESTGWLALEQLLNDATNDPTGLAHVPAHTIRKRKGEPGYVQVENGIPQRYFGPPGGRRKTGEDDERIFVDSDDGTVADSLGGVDTPANELITLRNYSALAPHYGTPDITPAIQTLAGDIAARQHQTTYFQNDATPRVAVIVEGGELSERAWNDLEETFKNLKAGDNSHRSVLIEAESIASSEFGENAGVNIRIEPLTVGVNEDADFLDYRDANEHKILQAHSVPPVVAGKTSGVNYASAKSQRKEFAQTVVRPRQERLAARLYDIIHRIGLGVPGWTLKFALHGGENELQQSEILVNRGNAIKATGGVVKVNEARALFGEEPLEDGRGDDLVSTLPGWGQGGLGGGGDAAVENARRDERNKLLGYSITERADDR